MILLLLRIQNVTSLQWVLLPGYATASSACNKSLDFKPLLIVCAARYTLYNLQVLVSEFRNRFTPFPALQLTSRYTYLPERVLFLSIISFVIRVRVSQVIVL